MISETLRQRLHKRLTEHVGLNLSGKGWHDFEARLQAAANDAKAVDTSAFIDEILGAPLAKATTQALARHFTVGETYFFRDQASINAFTHSLLPDLLHRRQADARQLRIWSAGCCTGEEAYSIAILLDNLLPDQKRWNITIHATDINEDFLDSARKGIYNEWSFRSTPAWVREKYFKATRRGGFELRSDIRRRVTFSYLNLADDNYPALTNGINNFDFIFCRNVLMYFAPEQLHAIVDKFYNALTEGGFLSVSPAETSSAVFSRYQTVNYPGAIFYQRQRSPQRKPALSVTPPITPVAIKRSLPSPAIKKDKPRVSPDKPKKLMLSSSNAKKTDSAPATTQTIKIVVIGASTGGPLALMTLLRALPKNFFAPIVVVQHMSFGFMNGLIDWLASSLALPVHIAAPDEHMLPGHVYLAPDGFHLRVTLNQRIKLVDAPPDNGIRPSVRQLFQSVAEVYGQNAAAILLTGMGRDGAAELLELRQKGALTFAQDKESSVVHGMPGEAIKLEAALHIMPPEKIAAVLLSLSYAEQAGKSG